MNEVRAVLFTNFTNKEFVHTWDNVPYTFPAESTTYLPEYLANHFAKHLVDLVLAERGQTADHPDRPELIARCLASNPEFENAEEITGASAEEISIKLMQMRASDIKALAKKEGVEIDKHDDKKAVVDKIVKATATKGKDEESFEGLKKK